MGSLLESTGLDGREGDRKLMLRERVGQETRVAWGAGCCGLTWAEESKGPQNEQRNEDLK